MAPEPLPRWLKLPSNLDHVAQARDFVLTFCRSAGFNDETAQGLALAVHEAITNVIRHAHRQLSDASFEVHCHHKTDRIEIHILDEGEPFDVNAVPELDPAELRVGGRGVYLMRALTDELTCEPRGTRGNVLRLVKRLPGSKAPTV
jgi:anti-sigma regulatory factor (Ser/Thr protein kinase)